MSNLDAIEAARGGEAATRDAWRAVTPATREAIARIAEVPGDEEPPPAMCIKIALGEGANVDAVLAVTHGLDLADAIDPESRAVHAICSALDELDDALEGAQ